MHTRFTTLAGKPFALAQGKPDEGDWWKCSEAFAAEPREACFGVLSVIVRALVVLVVSF